MKVRLKNPKRTTIIFLSFLESVNNNQQIPKSPLKTKGLNESKNQNPNYDEPDCNTEMTGAKTITKIGTQVNDLICREDLGLKCLVIQNEKNDHAIISFRISME